MSRIFIALLCALATSVTMAGPADGNGNKTVVNISELDVPVDCDFDGTPDLSLDVGGWFQGRSYSGKGGPNIELTVFHLDLVYTNAGGEMWTWRDRGPDRLYFIEDDDGNPQLIIAVTGRSGLNIIGHLVFNLTTGEIVLLAGRHPFGGEIFGATSDDMACELLY